MPLVREGSIRLCPSPGSSDFPPGVSCGAAQRATHKAEDVCTMQADANSYAACFAVFDGHGGVLAAQRCDEQLAPRLLGLAPGFSAAEVEREFWRIDRELGAAGVPDGTTATVLLVGRGKAAPPPGLDEVCDSVHSTASTVSASSVALGSATTSDDPAALICALAHVGDSTAIRVDMCRPLSSSNHGALVLDATCDHTPKNPGEVARLERHWAVRSALASEAVRGADGNRPTRRKLKIEAGATGRVSEFAGAAAAGAEEEANMDQAGVSCAPADEEVGFAPVRMIGSAASSGRNSPHQSEYYSADEIFAHAATVFGQSGPAALVTPRQVASAAQYVLSSGDEDSSHGSSQRAAYAGRKPKPPLHSGGDRPAEVSKMEAVMHTSLFAPIYGHRAASTIGRRRLCAAGNSSSSSSPPSASMPMTVKANFKDGTDGPSTCVTRSIGDWDASRAVTPHPEISHFIVPPGRHERVVIASDGVWDRITHAQAAGVARRQPTAAKAAEAIVRLAEQKTLQKFNRLVDDISVVCVDLCPSSPLVPSASASKKTVQASIATKNLTASLTDPPPAQPPSRKGFFRFLGTSANLKA